MRAFLRLFWGFRWGEIESGDLVAAVLERNRKALEFDIDFEEA